LAGLKNHTIFWVIISRLTVQVCVDNGSSSPIQIPTVGFWTMNGLQMEKKVLHALVCTWLQGRLSRDMTQNTLALYWKKTEEE
jgi:hypothetical protein